MNMELMRARKSPQRLTVNLPPGTLAALKIHAVQRETTIREVVTILVQTVLEQKGKRP
ncbi:hypothetical protein [Rhizobium rhizogenes]|uniref:hypothetical protein n=1 Tax=Rhizobium rhizogenes TaxID=359 RepID=UPI0012971062|nr:hypothetical protein [Rhizobium rhizogenes]